MVNYISSALRGALVSGLALCSVQAQAGDTPQSTIENLFKAMYAGNGAAVRSAFVEDATLDRATKEGGLRRSGFSGWADWVDTQQAGDADERIFGLKVQEFGSLATVWAPFKLWYKGDLVSCGVNTFTLTKIDTDWKIIHGIDRHHDGDCTDFNP
ncbi:hypothetical protein GCM10017044_15820 [Kordiimonas sediminis]|uniref:Nuclear transport factor 2 family protein n=1 Tax=Kordiimonas sediminis TaxID=1735581 RepID=A0A919AS89_9PROT|nr:nuclear transport factor 2 family protein [Kordiimonas sediminis]GHF22422.1 hypothetical protein GCM10017044_15820 [Kordiimonas sediminis]